MTRSLGSPNRCTGHHRPMHTSRRASILMTVRLEPDESSLQRMLLRRDASLQETKIARREAAGGPATAAGDARFWQNAAIQKGK